MRGNCGAKLGVVPAVLTVLCGLQAVRQSCRAEETVDPAGLLRRLGIPVAVLAELEQTGCVRRQEDGWLLLDEELWAKMVDGVRAVCQRAMSQPDRISPDWDSKSGNLCLAEQLVKSVAPHASAQRELLAALQADGWPPEMKNPLEDTSTQESGTRPRPSSTVAGRRRLIQAVRGLNQGQKVLKFTPVAGGRRVTWEIVSTT